MTTSKRALLLLVADIKKNVKDLNITEEKMYDVYVGLTNTLRNLVMINYETEEKAKRLRIAEAKDRKYKKGVE